MESPAQLTSFIRSQFQQRRFDDATIRALESILIVRDVKLLIQLQSVLKDFMRSESLVAIREIAEKPIDYKLSVLEFLVRAFAIVNDVESCLALRYEALAARESVSSIHQNWRVSLSEWIAFVEDSFDSGFYSIAGKACELVLLRHRNGYHKQIHRLNDLETIEKLRLLAMSLSSTHTVWLQTSEYLKEKNMRGLLEQSSSKAKICCSATTSFRDGIKTRNLRNLKNHQSIEKTQKA